MADGINIRILERTNNVEQADLLIVDNKVFGTRTTPFSALMSGFNALSSFVSNTIITGTIPPSGSIIPTKEGTLYYSSNNNQLYISVGTVDSRDWRRVLTAGNE